MNIAAIVLLVVMLDGKNLAPAAMMGVVSLHPTVESCDASIRGIQAIAAARDRTKLPPGKLLCLTVEPPAGTI